MLSQVRQCGQPVVLLDAGGAFGAAGGASSMEASLRAEYLLRGMAMCGYDAMNLGDDELRFGEVFLGQQTAAAQTSTLSANLFYLYEGGTPYTQGYLALQVGGITVGVIGVVSAGMKQTVEESSAAEGIMVTVGDPVAAISAAVAALDSPDLVVVLAHMSRDEALELALSVSDVDVIVTAHDKIQPSLATESGDALVLTTGYDGKWVARLDLTLDAQNRILGYENEAVMLDDRFEDDPALAALYEEYLARVEGEAERIIASIPQETPPSGTAYVGVAGCRDCHVEQATFWSTTKHAVALQTLVDLNHDYVPSCLKCHTTGFGFVGGFLLPSETPGLGGVQCEACHGAGEDHVYAPNDPWPTDPPEGCTRCHTPENSPEFDLETYLPEVQHPLVSDG